LAVLLLPTRLEDFELAAHARDLLDIPRVVAIEPPRWQGWRPLPSEILAIRQARRLRFPGAPKAVVLYHPRQFHLARALSAQHKAELWYVTGASLGRRHGEAERELELLDERAREVAAGLVAADLAHAPRADNQALRDRFVELGIISSKPFFPGARIGTS
jgi:hypothetical protein